MIPFALLIPRMPIITNFEETNGIFHVDVPNPRDIANVSFFLTSEIPNNCAIALYYSLYPFN